MEGVETEALPAGTRLEKYELLRFLGQGGGGITYLAKDSQLERWVVLKEHFPLGYCHRDTETGRVIPTNKEIYERSLQVFCREVRILASLNYEGIVRVHEAFAACDTVFMVMDYVDGATLKTWMAEHPAAEEIERVLGILLDTLEHLNSRNIIHRDIKPGNIIINERGLPILIDFGAAMIGEVSRTLTMVGSPSFSAPEQFIGARSIDTRADIYSLARSFMVVAEEYGIDLPPRILDTLKKASALNPDDRYAITSEWKEALRDYSMREERGGVSILYRRPLVLFSVAGAIFVTLLVVGIICYTGNEDKPISSPIDAQQVTQFEKNTESALNMASAETDVLVHEINIPDDSSMSSESVQESVNHKNEENQPPPIAQKQMSGVNENIKLPPEEKTSAFKGGVTANSENAVPSKKTSYTAEDVKFLSLYDQKRMDYVESKLDHTKLIITKPIKQLSKKEIAMLVKEMTSMEEYKKIFPIPDEVVLPDTKKGDSLHPAHPLDLASFSGDFLVDYDKVTDHRERAFLDAVATCHSRYLNMQVGVICERNKCRRNRLDEHWPSAIGAKCEQLFQEMQVQFVMDFVKIYCAYIEKYFNGKDPREDALRAMLY